ncbi:hypothetical protein KM176_16575 [Pseudooceanicola sp. CBS1P-1]|uniref:Uncharacterized protein n=1 Tax=Pseudooceanicola albus TaxID=2692189 RepID=A0A6L7G6E5_9RHOB|nr:MULTISPECIES: hypothetical protein [Pseudooceanicola]MBT9385491.1 hypothetical protein [Pseudooceanicola endophyticus]MXN19097.1 hypothetical protein [Pseudooceanicola albus]
MRTAQEIRSLDPEARGALLKDLAAEVFSGPALVSRLTEALDITRQSWARWLREPDKIPAWPILLLQEWAFRKRLSADLGRLPFDADPARSGTDAPDVP